MAILSRGERGPRGDHGQHGTAGKQGARGPRGRSSAGEWVRWGLTMLAVVVTLTSVQQINHEADVRAKADRQSLAQRDATDLRLNKAISAHCQVLAQLVQTNATRKQTEKLFAPIRARQPELFDRLVRRSKKREQKLRAAALDLTCPVKLPK